MLGLPDQARMVLVRTIQMGDNDIDLGNTAHATPRKQTAQLRV